ncbi:NAD(P)-dependent alcohol dehydrogenase [Chloroflexota bacterium]
MRAIVYEKYGPPEVLQLKEVDKPTMKDNEVLIKVHASTVSSLDWKFRSGEVFVARLMSGIRKPRKGILGTEVSGEVESAGKDVTQFKQGDQVFADVKYGGYAEYVACPEQRVVVKPANMSYEEATTISFAGVNALVFLRDYGKIKSGQSVLINGASGGVGTYAVQLAKHFGTQVTAVCSTPNLEMVKSLGADEVIDYIAQDFTETGATYDLIFDAVAKSSFSKCKGSLNKGGIYLSTVITWGLLFKMLWTKMIGNKKAKFGIGNTKHGDIDFMKKLIEAGEVRAIIDRTYRLEQLVEAHTYAEQGHVKGKVVITVPHDE